MKKNQIVHRTCFLCTLFLLLCPSASLRAADMPAQGFGFHIGWAQPILRINSQSNPAGAKDSLSTNLALNGFKAGIVYDASFIAGFGSSVGINYTFATTNTGWKAAGIYGNYPRSRRLTTYNELELFVDWQYKFEVAKETYIILYTGPTLQCGLGLNMRVDKQNDFDAEVISDRYSAYSTDNENEHFRRLNVTWGIGAGFQYRRFFLRGGYDFGLINPYANARFVDAADQPIDHYTRGRLDQWNIKIGMYIWYNN